MQRAPILPCLRVPQSINTLFQPFKSPCLNRSEKSNELLKKKTLGVRRSFSGYRPMIRTIEEEQTPDEIEPCDDTIDIKSDDEIEIGIELEPLILYQPEEGEEGTRVSVDISLVRHLREHQREGVQFMFNCVTGRCGFDGMGCILADDMGLGKTFQSITLLWTLLRQGVTGKPTVKRAIIVCPTSLVKNWEKEILKWVGDRVKVVALSEASREHVTSAIRSFTTSFASPILVISYDTFRLHADSFVSRYYQPGDELIPGKTSCDLLICDEAHRLKNDKTLTTQALSKLECKRRVLLSGTPMQNDLEEFYSMGIFFFLSSTTNFTILKKKKI